MEGIFYWVQTVGGRPYDDCVEREVGKAIWTNRHLLTCPVSEIPEDRIIDLKSVMDAARRAQIEAQ
jgi:hypothetical protein